MHLEAANPLSEYHQAVSVWVLDLRRFLETAGMPTTVADLNREHIEAYLVQLRERTSAVNERYCQWKKPLVGPRERPTEPEKIPGHGNPRPSGDDNLAPR